MSVKKKHKNKMLIEPAPSGSLLYDKDFSDEIKEKYKDYELTEEDMMGTKKNWQKLQKEFKNLREGR